MALPSSSSRAKSALSLRVPIANEDERVQFQRRLILTLTVIFLLAFAFWAFQLITVATVLGGDVGLFLSQPTVHVQLATTFSALAAAIAVGTGKPSARILGIADVVSTVGLCIGWALMTLAERGPASQAPRLELVPLLAASYTLATRAALVPSTPARSFLVGLGAMLPLLPMTYAIRSTADDSFRAVGPTIYIAIWVGVGIACTTTISYVIYGLRLQVRKAMQLGQYLLEEKIGEGGMGVVYRASHALLRRPTAIKLLSGGTGPAVERFEREVQITARLTHPNTVAVFDYGRTPDHVFYYAMEYLDGVTLEDLVKEHGPQPPERVVHILAQICGALVEAHAHGLVHRDIKPANVMLTERGCVQDVVKVLDFGLVKETAQPDPGMSGANTILGTPHYMAPEAIRSPNEVDARTDLYSVGATAYFLLAGERVFKGETLVEVCSQHLHQPPVPLRERRPDIPESLDKVVLACLAKKPGDRPANAKALGAMLLGCELAEWTPEDAAAWWKRHDAKTSSGKRRRAPAPSSASGEPPLVKTTIAVDLDDRGAA